MGEGVGGEGGRRWRGRSLTSAFLRLRRRLQDDEGAWEVSAGANEPSAAVTNS